MMHEIYTQAKTVFIWLGLAEKGDGEAISFTLYLYEKFSSEIKWQDFSKSSLF